PHDGSQALRPGPPGWFEPPPSQGLHGSSSGGVRVAGGGRGGHRGEGDLRVTYAPAGPTPRGTLRPFNRGLTAPTDPTRSGREAGGTPAQSRYGDRPLGRKSG